MTPFHIRGGRRTEILKLINSDRGNISLAEMLPHLMSLRLGYPFQFFFLKKDYFVHNLEVDKISSKEKIFFLVIQRGGRFLLNYKLTQKHQCFPLEKNLGESTFE